MHARRFRPLLPRRPVQGRPVRRLVRHRRTDDEDLLPPQLPCPATVRPQHALLSDCRGRAGSGLPGLQAVPSRRIARIPGVERPRRRGGPGDATDRRRHGGSRRRHWAGGPRRLHHPAAGTVAASRGGRQSPCPGPRAADADRAGVDRDDRPAIRRRRVRRRLLEHPPVQRHGSVDLRTDSYRAPGTRPHPIRARLRRLGGAFGATAGAHAVRLRGRVRPSGRQRRARCRGGSRRRLPPHAATAVRQRRREPDPSGRPRQMRVGARRIPRPVHRDRPVPTAARPRCRPRGHGRCVEQPIRAERHWSPRHLGNASHGPSTSPNSRYG